MHSRFGHRICGGLLLLGTVVLFGCGPNLKARATVKGKVTFAGKNLTTGSVTFISSTNDVYRGSSPIDKNGDYHMTDAPIGEVKIEVYVPPVNPMYAKLKAGMKKEMKEKKSVDPEGSGKSIPMMGDMSDRPPVPIAEKYHKAETSGLTYTVQRGEQTKDLPLTP